VPREGPAQGAAGGDAGTQAGGGCNLHGHHAAGESRRSRSPTTPNIITVCRCGNHRTTRVATHVSTNAETPNLNIHDLLAVLYSSGHLTQKAHCVVRGVPTVGACMRGRPLALASKPLMP
jgi:hypothetical protein